MSHGVCVFVCVTQHVIDKKLYQVVPEKCVCYLPVPAGAAEHYSLAVCRPAAGHQRFIHACKLTWNRKTCRGVQLSTELLNLYEQSQVTLKFS